jgi:biopolymer transport protein ExbD
MKFQRHYSITKGELNLTPLIDVVFLQLIYFMLTSSFIMQPGIKINLPEATAVETITEKEVIVSISEEGIIYYRDIPVTLEQREKSLARDISPDVHITLIVKGDKKAEHGVVVKVMDTARRVGINKIAVATMPEF